MRENSGGVGCLGREGVVIDWQKEFPRRWGGGNKKPTHLRRGGGGVIPG